MSFFTIIGLEGVVEMIDVRDFIIEGLRGSGFYGLINHDKVCSCSIERIAPCESMSPTECQPGYKIPCDGTCPDKKCSFHISLERKHE